MRRYIAFITLAISLLALVLFNVQSRVEGLSWSQEFERGTEVVYRISDREDEEASIQIDKVVKNMGNRLEEAGATNYSIDSAYNKVDNNYEVKIVLGTKNTSDIDNILRSTKASGEFSIFTTDGTSGVSGEEAILRDTAEVLYNENHEAYIKVETSKEVETVVTKAKEDTGNSLLVLWQNKTDDIDYTDLKNPDFVYKGLTNDELKDRVLAVIDLSEPTQEEGQEQEQTIDNSNWTHDEKEDKYYLTFKAFGYADGVESAQPMDANSAHSIERVLNSNLLEYDIEQVYRRNIAPGYGANSIAFIVCSVSLTLLITCLFLVVKYRSAALSGCLGIALTGLACLFVLSMFNLTITPSVIFSVFVTLAFSVSMLLNYYTRTQDEVIRGRAVSKSSNEGFRRTIMTAVDGTILLFTLGVVLTLISREGVKIFSIFFIFSSLFNLLLVFFLGKILNNFLLNSHKGNNPKIINVNPDNVVNLDGVAKSEVKHSRLENLNPHKSAKKTGIIAGCAVILSVVGLIITGFTTGVFNYSSQTEFSRIEIRSADNAIFQDNPTKEEKPSELALDQFVAFIEKNNKDENLKVSNAWAVTDQKNPYEDDKNYIYLYADLTSVIDVQSDTFIALEEYVLNFDNDEATRMVNVYTVKAGIVEDDFLNTILITSVAVGITFVYFMFRYRYTLVLSATSLLIGGGVISYGLLSVTRLAANSYVGAGILAGLLINVLFLIPFFNRYNQLKNESKVKITTYEQRKEVALDAFKSSISSYVSAMVLFTTLLIAAIAISPIKMYTSYLAAIISLIIGALLIVFGLLPLNVFFDKTLKFNKIRANRAKKLQLKREKIAKANRNKGAEPEEIIIPGIND